MKTEIVQNAENVAEWKKYIAFIMKMLYFNFGNVAENCGNIKKQRMNVVKLLTLNTHSLQEVDGQQKLDWLVAGILRERPDILALQEVNQTFREALIEPHMLEGQYPVPGCMPIRRDNYAAQIAWRLRQSGESCYWAWLPVKQGPMGHEEGVAVLSLGWPIRCIDAFPISKSSSFQKRTTRAVLGVQVEGRDDWFYCLKMASWDAEPDTFLDQWKKLNCCIAGKRMCGTVWLLGDFAAPDDQPKQGYAHIAASGWYDTYKIAQSKDCGITAPRADGKALEGTRIDYIWCSRNQPVLSAGTMFNGITEPVVSSHYGVLIETKE